MTQFHISLISCISFTGPAWLYPASEAARLFSRVSVKGPGCGFLWYCMVARHSKVSSAMRLLQAKSRLARYREVYLERSNSGLEVLCLELSLFKPYPAAHENACS